MMNFLPLFRSQVLLMSAWSLALAMDLPKVILDQQKDTYNPHEYFLSLEHLLSEHANTMATTESSIAILSHRIQTDIDCIFYDYRYELVALVHPMVHAAIKLTLKEHLVTVFGQACVDHDIDPSSTIRSNQLEALKVSIKDSYRTASNLALSTLKKYYPTFAWPA